MPGGWLQSITTLLAVTEDLDRQLAVLDGDLRPVARADDRVRPLMSIPGIGERLGLTIASEIGDIARFPSARKLVGYSGPVPRVVRPPGLLGGRDGGPAHAPTQAPRSCMSSSSRRSGTSATSRWPLSAMWCRTRISR